MEVSRATIVHALCVFFIFRVSVAQDQKCSENWFGNCQYKCHCRNEKGVYSCNEDGSCLPGFQCDKGWFGPGCQYVDLASKDQQHIGQKVLTDGNENTCNLYRNLRRLELKVRPDKGYTMYNGYTFFTWLRLHVNNPGDIYNIIVHLRRGDTKTEFRCPNQRYHTIDDTTADIYCDVRVPIDLVVLIGDGVKALCSVYISGGRNLALKQRTTLSSEHWRNGKSSNAVDGNTDGEYDKGSCAHSLIGTGGHTWTVQFQGPVSVNTYMLYQRQHYHEELLTRLQGFTITSLNKDNITVFTYQDKEVRPRQNYTVQATLPCTTGPIYEVKIYSYRTLTLCEVELYGDCYKGWYGLGCNLKCSPNCAGDGSCFSTSGHCAYGCKTGFKGPQCNVKVLNAEDLTKIDFYGVCGLLVVVIVVSGVILYCKKAVTCPCKKRKIIYNDLENSSSENDTYGQLVRGGIPYYNNEGPNSTHSHLNEGPNPQTPMADFLAVRGGCPFDDIDSYGNLGRSDPSSNYGNSSAINTAQDLAQGLPIEGSTPDIGDANDYSVPDGGQFNVISRQEEVATTSHLYVNGVFSTS